MRGVGIVFSRFLEVDVNTGVVIGMVIVFFYASLGGMKGITWTQVAQYLVLIIAFLVPAVAISMKITGNPLPQLGFGDRIAQGPDAGMYFLQTLDAITTDLGFGPYTKASSGLALLNMVAVTTCLMVGTAGLPHVIIRFYTVPTVRAARLSAFYAILFIAILYTAAPAVGAFARYNMIRSVNGVSYAQAPSWFKNWERTGLIAWVDKNNDGIIQYTKGLAIAGKPQFTGQTGPQGQRLLANKPADGANELFVDNDIMVLANPEIANLPAWVIALVAAGGLAAALSTASGLLLVIASAISHDLYYRVINPKASEKNRLTLGRVMIGLAVLVAGYFGINPPGFVAQVVSLAFGLAASSFFPIIVLGVFWKRATREGAIAGMSCGIGLTLLYIIQVKFLGMQPWLFGLVPEGVGVIGMLLNFTVTAVVSLMTAPPPEAVQELVEHVRIPRGAGAAIDH
jgi:cation/acetate symporter